MLPPAEQQQVATALEHDAEVMTNTQLEELLADEPPAMQDEIIRINTDARPVALQVALLVPLIAASLGLVELVQDDAAARPRTVGGGGDGARRLAEVVGERVDGDRDREDQHRRRRRASTSTP